MRSFVSGKISYPVLIDANGPANAYGVRGIPANFFIDREGNIGDLQVGFHGEAGLESAIQKILQ